MTPPRIVIVGGGFAGVKCAKTLARRLGSKGCELVLFNRENHMVFHPLLPEVAGASIDADCVAAPLRQMLSSVRCRTEDVLSIDLVAGEVEYEGHDGLARRMSYDHVVIACGRPVSIGRVPGMADHSFPLKTIGDALALRTHVMEQLEKADVCDDPDRQRWYLSFVVVGGGYSGVESAGELNDLVRGSQRFFSNTSTDAICVSIIHSRDQLLPEVSPDLRERARVMMEQAGIAVILNARVAVATPDGVVLQDGRAFRAATVVCTIGTAASPVVQRLDAPKEGGRLLTDPDLRVQGFANVWAIGDCARIVNAHDGRECPPTGQFAEREGRQAAENIVRVLRGDAARSFSYKPIGQLCAIGGRKAVAEILGVQLSGFLAWFVWRGVYLFKLPSWPRRVKVGFDWAWDLVFPRDLAHLKTDQTERVSSAHYEAGDFVFRSGDPATSLYVIEKGQVEVLRRREGEDDEQVVAVMGAGDFFGEMALIENRPRGASVRARTPVEVTVLGREVFSQVSRSLTSLRHIVSDAVKRRAKGIWLRLPVAHEILSKEPLATFVEPPPPVHLRPDQTLQDALALFREHDLDVCLVLDDREWLVGIVTRTDFLNAIEVVAALPAGQRGNVRVREFMVANPIALTRDDSSVVAAETMRDHGLKGTPIIRDRDDRRVVGYLWAEDMMYKVFERTQEVASRPA